ncbi:hypothetical protein CJD36_015955 [Flavipsychrobacter stenotrophus]|uniref:Uncharacterized protein n=1 Tax=Flavipsychrobacter stenotrophus TaxID=2077091 RepID=A0A2S7SUB2_9BACT|nr:hypothetical protein [Flavipsychrobacter stenotrophus]PQJ10185.1 hypothetical protein CJD36_015955 [Flavipsychrobacter stenotrophus]
MRKTYTIVFSSLVLLVQSCDRQQCKNTDAVFDQFKPIQKEYKAELVKKISMVEREKLTYWISERIVDDGRTYMVVDVQGDGLCAKAVIDITYVPQTSSLKSFQESTGKGYSGAKLDGLKYSINNMDGEYNFFFVNVDRIVD